MAWWIYIPLGVYGMMFIFVLWMNLGLGGLVSPGLALLRAFVWPYFLLTGGPDGSPVRMD